jgi:uncharacterized protein (TIGR00369 family)
MSDESPYAQSDVAAQLNGFFADRLPGQLGYVLDVVSASGVEGHFTVTAPQIAGTGFLFAQVVVGFADYLCAMGVPFHTPSDASFTTIEVKANFLGSARAGERVEGCARPVHAGRSTQVWDAEIHNASTERPMALFRCTQMVLPGRRGG